MVGRSRAYTLNSEAAPGDILYCSSEYAGQDGSLQMLVITELSCTAKKNDNLRAVSSYSFYTTFYKMLAKRRSIW
jgi:hypothetical protein